MSKQEKPIMPIGGIIAWYGNRAENFDESGKGRNGMNGWAICNGNNGTPNLEGKFIIGTSSTYPYDTTGGKAEVTLSVSEMPSHFHTGNTDEDGLHQHLSQKSFRADNDDNDKWGNYIGSNTAYNHNPDRSSTHDISNAGSEHSHHFITDDTGQGEAHENLPPYHSLSYIMKIS